MTLAELDQYAIECARELSARQPQCNFLVDWLSGAPGAANTAGSYYQNAANDIYSLYGPSATKYFTNEQNLALRPQFNQQAQNLSGIEAAQGITHSGAGRANYGTLGVGQAGATASADAPLFSQGLAGATGVYSQMPGAQVNAYQDAINNFYQALSAAGSAAAGVPPTGLSGSAPPADTGAPNPYYG